jgi:hypothetical protein
LSHAQTAEVDGRVEAGQGDLPHRPGNGPLTATPLLDPRQTNEGDRMLYGLLGLIIVVAIVLFLLKVAIGGGILALIAVILLLMLLFGRL